MNKDDWPNSVTKKDLRIEYFRGSGAGGQKRNKTSSACRITHLPTGVTAQSQDERYQSQNLKTAFNRLAAKLVPLMVKEVQRERFSGGNLRIRTYSEKDNRVIDHRIPENRYQYDGVLDGKEELERLICDILTADAIQPITPTED